MTDSASLPHLGPTATPRPVHLGGPARSAIGLGTWALGGPVTADGRPIGWGRSWDRDEAIAVIRAAVDHGITVFDTADVYGAGTSERLLGEVLEPVRNDVALVSKWGNVVDEANRRLTGVDPGPDHLRRSIEGSLRRLRTDHLDLYLLHLSDLPIAQADELLGTLDELVADGRIRAYGWSTDDPARAAAWVGRPGFGGLEFEANVTRDAPDLIELVDDNGVPALVRGPLGTGLLAGKYDRHSAIDDDQDVRRATPDWLVYFRDGRPVPHYLDRLEAVADVLRSDGRTLAQGSLAWLLARSPHLVPVPGARTVGQVVENAGTLDLGPLSPSQMAEIAALSADEA